MKRRGSWDRELWGIQFSGGDRHRMLLGTLWNDHTKPRFYPGEPTRALLFTSRSLARDWCRQRMAKWKEGDSIVQAWRVTPVRVRESVRPERR